MNIETQKSGTEITKWTIIVILLITAIVSGYLCRNMTLPLCLVTVVVFISAAICIALLTEKGKAAVVFIREARTEVRKIIWPTRQKTLYTTLVIASVSFVMSLVLWGLDNILVRLISFTTNLRF